MAVLPTPALQLTSNLSLAEAVARAAVGDGVAARAAAHAALAVVAVMLAGAPDADVAEAAVGETSSAVAPGIGAIAEAGTAAVAADAADAAPEAAASTVADARAVDVPIFAAATRAAVRYGEVWRVRERPRTVQRTSPNSRTTLRL
mmetsp:Transcript_115664/g.226821  ORF Transcript_115664/g.226821 Transcript_115664/m.226821 type:complete len:146 (+) Transcript_115664:449-886(+)